LGGESTDVAAPAVPKCGVRLRTACPVALGWAGCTAPPANGIVVVTAGDFAGSFDAARAGALEGLPANGIVLLAVAGPSWSGWFSP
jgi:hypothetical protein